MFRAILLLCLFVWPVHADTYAPEYCDFSITLDDPYFSRQACRTEEDCIETISMTKEFENGYLTYDAHCAPLPADDKALYTEEALQALAQQAAIDEGLEPQSFSYTKSDDSNLVNATLTASGEKGVSTQTAVIQFWIMGTSFLNAKTVIIGQADEAMQNDIKSLLQAVRFRTLQAEPSAAAPTP